MDLIGWIGAGVGLIGGGLAFVAERTARRAVREAEAANRIAREANDIADRALEEQRGPEFAFEVEYAPSPDDDKLFRLRNTGWRAVSDVKFDPSEPGVSVFGSFTPEIVGDFDSMGPRESVRFRVGTVAPNRFATGWLTLFPTHVFVRVREREERFRVDLPARISST